MDLKRDQILRDLQKNLMDRVMNAASDTVSLCKAANIPRYECDQAVCTVFLYIFFGIFNKGKPTSTSNNLARIVESQFEIFQKGAQRWLKTSAPS